MPGSVYEDIPRGDRVRFGEKFAAITVATEEVIDADG